MQIVPAPNPTLDAYYAALSNYASLGVTHEQGVVGGTAVVGRADMNWAMRRYNHHATCPAE